MTATTRMLEKTSASIEGKIAAALDHNEHILVRAATDMDAAGQFGRQWVVATAQRLLVVSDVDGEDISIPIAHIDACHTEPLVGGGRLDIEQSAAPTLSLYYTSSEAAKFSEIARGVEQLRKGEDFVINPQLDRLRCASCARLLPETSAAASPALRGPKLCGTSWPVAALHSAITSLTEKPVPVPKLNTRLPLPSRSHSRPLMWASTKSITWT